MIGMIIGLGILCFLFLYFAFNLDTEHFLLKILCIFFFAFTSMLLPKVAIDNNCINLVTSENVTGGNITLGYSEVCTTISTTQIQFLQIPLWFFRIFITYFFIYISYHWLMKFEPFANRINKMRGKDDV
tara:strand:- start:1045 stop:1431 length:387 start_codon:yes stop_codon:yes gene_type:complete